MSTGSPKHRLKRKIESLDQQIKSSSHVSRSYNLPLSLLTSYDSERDELQKKINSMRIATLNKEQALTIQLKSLKQHLEISATKKKSELGSFKISKQALVSSIEKLKSKLQSYENEYFETSTLAEERNRIQQSSHAVKEKVFSESLEPLEFEAKSLEETKSEISDYISKLEDEKNVLENKILMIGEERIVLESFKIETVISKEETEAKFQMFCQEFQDELDFFQENDEKFKGQAKVKETINGHLEEMNKLAEEVRTNLYHQEKIKERLERLKQEISWTILNGGEWKLNKEILALEQKLIKNCKEMKIESLENLIEKESLIEGVDLKKEILRLQIIEISKVEENLRRELDFEEKQFYEKLILKNYGKAEKNDLEEDFHKKKRKLRNRILSIEKWRSSTEKKVLSFTQDFSPLLKKDKKIVQDFFSSLKGLDSKKEVEATVNTLISKLMNREKLQKSNFQLLQDKDSEKNELKINLQKVSKDLRSNKITILKLKQLLNIQKSKESLLPSPENSIAKEYFSLKSEIFLRKSCYFSNKNSLKLLNNLRSDLQTSLKSTNKLISSSKIKQKDIKQRLKSVHSLIICMNDTKFQNLSAQEISQESLLALKENIHSTKSELDQYLKELSSFESEFQQKLTQIEQEESKMRSQQQAVESALRNLEIDAKKIEEMESQLYSFEDFEGTPGSIDENKFRIPNLRPGIRLEDLETNDMKEGEEVESTEDLTHSMEINLGQSIENTPKFLKRSFRYNLENISNSENIFLDKLKPLLEGSEVLKKFITKSKIRNFDVLDSLNVPPDQCGYLLRHFYLHKSLSKIEIKANSKTNSESTIMTDQIWSILLSQNVLLVLKAQGYLKYNDLDYDQSKDRVRELMNFDVNSERFKNLCTGITLYPFSIVSIQGDQIDLVAKGYKSLKNWVNGLNGLIKYKNLIPKVRSRIEAYV